MPLLSKLITSLLLYLIFVYGCQQSPKSQIDYIEFLPSDITLCGSLDILSPDELSKLNNGEIKVALDLSENWRL